MKKLIFLSCLIGLIFFSCKKEPIEIKRFCWDCESYVTTIDTLHNTSFQSHFEKEILCDKTEENMSHIIDIIYKDTFMISPGQYYVCFRIYTTECRKLINN